MFMCGTKRTLGFIVSTAHVRDLVMWPSYVNKLEESRHVTKLLFSVHTSLHGYLLRYTSISDEIKATMATYSNIETFNGKREDFVQYIERVEQFFLANDLEVIEPKDDNGAAVTKRNNKRKAILLSLIGADTYSLLRNLLSPDKPADKTYAEIVKTLTDYFQPKPSATVQRIKFNNTTRKEGESVAQFLSTLLKAMSHTAV